MQKRNDIEAFAKKQQSILKTLKTYTAQREALYVQLAACSKDENTAYGTHLFALLVLQVRILKRQLALQQLRLKNPVLRLSEYKQTKTKRTARVVVYTAISGKYDTLREHSWFCDEWDYVCFTDNNRCSSALWDVRAMDSHHVAFRGDPQLRARWYKLFAHRLFPEYQYSIWVDGNIDVCDRFLQIRAYECIRQKVLMCLARHPSRVCAYDEALACMQLKKDTIEKIQNTMLFLKTQGYPEINGLYETNILIREHNHPRLIKTMEIWWQMLYEFSKRDQLSFCFAHWLDPYTILPLFHESDTIENTKHFLRRAHKISM